MRILLLIFLLCAIFFEGTITTLPLVVISFISLAIVMRNPTIFFLAFLSGILLDSFALRPIGEASVFLLIALFLMLLYQRKYEINTYPFVLLSSFVGSFVFLIIFGYQHLFLQAILCTFVSLVLYSFVRSTNFGIQSSNLHI